MQIISWVSCSLRATASSSLCEVASVICEIKKSINKSPIIGSRLSGGHCHMAAVCHSFFGETLATIKPPNPLKPPQGGAPPSSIVINSAVLLQPTNVSLQHSEVPGAKTPECRLILWRWLLLLLVLVVSSFSRSYWKLQSLWFSTRRVLVLCQSWRSFLRFPQIPEGPLAHLLTCLPACLLFVQLASKLKPSKRTISVVICGGRIKNKKAKNQKNCCLLRARYPLLEYEAWPTESGLRRTLFILVWTLFNRGSCLKNLVEAAAEKRTITSLSLSFSYNNNKKKNEIKIWPNLWEIKCQHSTFKRIPFTETNQHQQTV